MFKVSHRRVVPLKYFVSLGGQCNQSMEVSGQLIQSESSLIKDGIHQGAKLSYQKQVLFNQTVSIRHNMRLIKSPCTNDKSLHDLRFIGRG